MKLNLVLLLLLLLSLAPILVVIAKKDSSSPWCTDPQHPAEVGMYGDMGYVDLINNEGQVPENVIGLFRQGLTHIYGFNNFEALRNFRTATKLSPDCALCFWGVAMSFAPNINYYIENQTALNDAANTASKLAKSQNLNLSSKSHALIDAIAKFVAPANFQDSPDSPYRKAYANALCTNKANDADINVFCAGASMALSPWHYYQGIPSGGHFPMMDFLLPAKAKLLDAVNRGPHDPSKTPTTATRSSVVEGHPHIFAIHLLIHLLEPSNAPEKYRWEALGPTKMLYNSTAKEGDQEAIPAQGHLTHMPAHLFLRTGLYMDAVKTSTISTGDNSKYITKCLNPYGLGHNLKMYVANARLAGRLQDSLEHAAAAGMPDAGQESTPNGGTTCVDCAGTGNPEYILTLVRFAQWNKVINVAKPNFQKSVPSFAVYNEAEYHFARAVAYWALSNKGTDEKYVSMGDAEAKLCLALAPKTASPTQGFNYTGILPEELTAIRALRIENNWTKAIEHYKNVVAADDLNFYLEPPRMFYPPRQCLGALLSHAPTFDGGNNTVALEVFETDLLAFVGNAWSLYGAATAASNLGMKGKSDEYREKADHAWKDADVKFISPCPHLFA